MRIPRKHIQSSILAFYARQLSRTGRYAENIQQVLRYHQKWFQRVTGLVCGHSTARSSRPPCRHPACPMCWHFDFLRAWQGVYRVPDGVRFAVVIYPGLPVAGTMFEQILQVHGNTVLCLKGTIFHDDVDRCDLVGLVTDPNPTIDVSGTIDGLRYTRYVFTARDEAVAEWAENIVIPFLTDTYDEYLTATKSFTFRDVSQVLIQ